MRKVERWAREGRGVVSDNPVVSMDPERLGLDFGGALVRTSVDGITVLDRDRRIVYANPAACEMLGYPLDRLLGQDSLTLLPEHERQTYRTFLEKARSGHSQPRTEIVYRPDGSEREVQLTTTVLSFESRRFLVVASRDVTERHRRAREAAALAQAASRVAVSDSTQATVEAIAECALGGTRALAAWVTLDSEDEVAAWVGAAGVPEGFRVWPAACPAAACRIFMQALMAQRVVVYADARQQVESQPAAACAAGALRSLPWRAAAFTPLLFEGAVVGVMTAIYRKDELPYEAETTFLAALADQATMAASNARLLAAAREKVALEERQRLARELHDSVSQSLFGIQVGARMAHQRLDQDRAQIAQPIDHVMQLAEDCQAEMRALICTLRPELLEVEGLVTALNKEIEALRTRHGIAAQSIASDEPELAIDVKQALQRIAHEAVHNTVKHARARHLDIHFKAHGGSLVLEIADDGVGFDPDQGFPGHLGLRSMRERAHAVGGSLDVVSSRGRGTRIVVSVPSATS
ncbi:MAG TPA: PAS domain S-box protein [Candidatus Dormibacteraeota bacterium]|nr:PAS domain S-box protein [Candidatus Dormibacteraeota bacterium]